MPGSICEIASNSPVTAPAGELPATVLLLLAVADAPARPWSLLTAASTLLGRPLAAPDLERLFSTGVLRQRNGAIAARDDASARRALAQAHPSRLAQAHLAWRDALVEDELDHARHTALAWMQPDESKSARAVATAIRLQASNRHEAAVEMFAQAARLSVSVRERARVLTRGAGCAFAAGLRRSGDDLLVMARGLDPDDDIRRVGDLLQRAFTGDGGGDGHTWRQHLEASRVLMQWQQSAAAFAVLASAPAAGWPTADLDRVARFFAQRDRDVIEGLVLLRGGQMSTCLAKLTTAAGKMHASEQWGVTSVAYALSAEAAVCLGQVSTGAQLLQRIRAIRLARPARLSADLAGLVEALLAARQGRARDAEIAQTLARAMLSADRTERDLAELVCAVDLVACERWHDAFDLLAELLTRVDGVTTQLVSWGLLSHFADAARHTGQVDVARRLVSNLGDADGLFEGDIALAELLYATAVLSNPEHADACYQTFLSHNPVRWPWLTARAHLAYGQQLRRKRRVGEARGHLVSAQRLFAAMNVAAWERRAAGELRAAGVRQESREHPLPKELALSAQELQIARMAARGLSNREIGQSLFLSPRTIGSHLYRIFPKLNVTSRIQLSNVLSRG